MDIGLVVRLAVGLAVGALVGWFGGFLLGVTASSVTAAIVLRTLLSVGILVILTRMLVRRTTNSPALGRSIVAGAVLSYAISPAAWSGRALAAQLVADPGVVTVLLDAVIWVAVVVLAARTVEPQPEQPEYRPYAR
jgi:hypothetical protein